MTVSVASPLCGGRWLGKNKRGEWQWGEYPSRKRFEDQAAANVALDDVYRAIFGDVKIVEEA